MDNYVRKLNLERNRKFTVDTNKHQILFEHNIIYEYFNLYICMCPHVLQDFKIYVFACLILYYIVSYIRINISIYVS